VRIGCGLWPRQTCGTRCAGPGRRPTPDRAGPAQEFPVFRPAVHAARASSAARHTALRCAGFCLHSGKPGGFGRVLKTCRPQGLPDRKAGNSSACARALRILAGAIAPATAPRCPLPAGGQSPRPAPDPPPAGALHPPGRALACRKCGHHGSLRQRRARAGETRCVS